VPLTEAQYRRVLEKVASLNLVDNLAGVSVRDRVQSHEILVHAIREEDDLSQRVFHRTEEMLETLEVTDIDELIDRYNEMMEKSSPALDGIPAQELEVVKKALQTMDWSDLSGRSWYALKRFLSTVMPTLLSDNLLGSTSTSLLTTTSESDESTSTVSPNFSNNSVKSVTSPSSP
jgi:hypothetical protein